MATDTDPPRRRARKTPAAGTVTPAPGAIETDAASRLSPAPRSDPAPATRAPRPRGAAQAEPAVNSIGLARSRTPKAPPAQEAAAPEKPLTDTNPSPAEAANSAIPEHIRERFIQIGRRYYLPNGDPAFRDHGTRLSTRSENTEIIRAMVEIAKERYPNETLRIRGTDRFRREAWGQAKLAGLSVRGYRPTDIEQALLVRTIDRERRRAQDILAGRSPEGPDRDEPVATPAPSGPRVPERERTVPAENRAYQGRLLEHGAANYQHDRHAELSYYVKVQTRAGETTLWGKDFERAIRQSLSGVKKGDDIAVLHAGEKAVTVTARRRDEDGNFVRKEEVAAYRNRWIVERQDFLKERAEVAKVVRDPTVDAENGTKQHPNLVGTYVELHAAKLVAADLYANEQDRSRFVARIRQALAEEIERGEPYSVPRVRTRSPQREPVRERGPLERAQGRVLS
jgi:putative DNA primase/helicase